MGPKRWALLPAVVLLLALSGVLLPVLNRQRDAFHLTANPTLENAPPELVLFTTALGAFRGLIIDMLWMRASELQEQSKYFELVQLYDWIGKLEPRMEEVWAYAAWNMAYNISVALDRPADRWLWVRRGLEVLRNEGILKHNTRSEKLCRELAWIYYHKLGGTDDDFHRYYKRQLASSIQRILGTPQPDLEALGAAPQHDEDPTAAPGVGELIDRLRAAGHDPLGANIRWLDEPERLPEETQPIVEEARDTPAYKALEGHLRVKRLWEEWRLEPARMLAVLQEFGPVDFRSAYAHALYWAVRGREYLDPNKTDPIFIDRQIYFVIAGMFFNGRIVFRPGDWDDPTDDFLLTTPDVGFARRAYELLMEARTKHENAGGTGAFFREFLKQAPLILLRFNRAGEAEFYFNELKRLFPREVPEDMALDEYVIELLTREVAFTNRDRVKAEIMSFIAEALNRLALERDEEAAGFELLAGIVHRKYNEYAAERNQLPEYIVVRGETIRFLLDPESSPWSPPLRDLLRRRLGLPAESQ